MPKTMIRLFHDQDDCVLQNSSTAVRVPASTIDQLFQSNDPGALVSELLQTGKPTTLLKAEELAKHPWKPPVSDQEIWAAGVTYFRSRSARMEESQSSGGDQFYDMVYDAERPELFFKSTASRARGHLDKVCIRSDSTWDVPEPELTLAINQYGKVFGFSIGNDMSSRSIEGENPLYLPQAKIYRGSCALGPCLLICDSLDRNTKISIEISRSGSTVFSGSIEIDQIKRTFDELAEYLFRDNDFSKGVYLMTGTGIVPDSSFTLASGDRVLITIDSIGTLVNDVE